jgi:NTE family protein
MRVARGVPLLIEGEPADALFLVISGRFQVHRAGQSETIAEIGAGQPIGEIAFFKGGARTASVTALRDSLVLKLGRADFDRVAAEIPELWRGIAASLADRLAATTAMRQRATKPRPRTIALIRAGPVPKAGTHFRDFVGLLTAEIGRTRRSTIVDAERARSEMGASANLDGVDATAWLNTLEEAHETTIYVADDELSGWSRKAIRQADVVLLVGAHEHAASAMQPNELERYALSIHRPESLRLVLLHLCRTEISGTRRWLAQRGVHMHHHVALDTPEDLHRLVRFLDGTALGLVASGGGAFCAVHVGLYDALTSAGLVFDCIGGTSGGAGMAAAFALGIAPAEIDRRMHDIFVTRRALRRWTWPRYAVLDHTVLDAALREHFTETDITDLWVPFFAVSTNLSRGLLNLHREGKLWEAVRASGAIPGLLPPFFTSDGELLVDGAVIDNVPVRAMHALKPGPNVVIAFDQPRLDAVTFDYESLPSRSELMRSMVVPGARARLPSAPGLRTVLMRSLAANRIDTASILGPEDLLLVPPLPDDMSVLDWSRHAELVASAYRYGLSAVARLTEEGHPLLVQASDRRRPTLEAAPTAPVAPVAE